MDILQLLWSSILQVAVFSLVPFLWWCVTARKKEELFCVDWANKNNR